LLLPINHTKINSGLDDLNFVLKHTTHCFFPDWKIGKWRSQECKRNKRKNRGKAKRPGRVEKSCDIARYGKFARVFSHQLLMTSLLLHLSRCKNLLQKYLANILRTRLD